MDALPVDDHLPAIVEALGASGCAVLVAEPGAGKTTRVPPALLRELEQGDIWVLQPRRIAARMAARRVAHELGEPVGVTIGYQVRFEQRKGPRTRVHFVTEGVFTRRLMGDPRLGGISLVILDEFHERSLHADLALARLRELRRTCRPDLRVLVMSATVDAEAVAEYLGCPVLRVPGRVFPVDVSHQEDQLGAPLDRQVATALRALVRQGLDGDVLVFLPGAAEIRRARAACEPVCRAADMELAVLHGDLSAQEQDRAVASGGRPKLILSTNIAETSLTLPQVVAVIDSGLARVAGHNPWTGLPTLTTWPISQASAGQRAGRAGRVRAGRCIRLYGRHDFKARALHDKPEVLRADLSELVLMLAGMGSWIAPAGWLQPPPASALARAIHLLEELGAVTASGGAPTVTDVGRAMLRLPVHPRLARLLLAAHAQGVEVEGAGVVALLSERDIVRSRRDGILRGTSTAAGVGPSDLLERLDLLALDDCGGGGTVDRRTARAVCALRDRLVRALGPSEVQCNDTDAALGQAVLSAFSDRVARRRNPGQPEFVLARGGSVVAAPESVVQASEFAVVVDVSDVRDRGRSPVARMLSAIEPDWLLEQFPERVVSQTRTRFDPDSERVDCFSGLAFEGLTLDETAVEPTGVEVEHALLQAARERGFARLFDLVPADAFVRRWVFAAQRSDVPAPPEDPIDAAVALACQGHCSFADLRRQHLVALLQVLVGHEHLQTLEAAAPERVTLPRGRRVVVHYEADRPPWIASSLQDFFGQTDGPKLAGEPLVLHLLAPNRRAVQVTQDLAGFWARHYPGLRKALMRRYPKHAWPEKPV
ncbi:MAG: ATP-dependent helicase HrpB [Myxococcales bacterium]|nr:ATP-dependent helicase HrpB [Myxococcales bacterium]